MFILFWFFRSQNWFNYSEIFF